ncbi:MAG: DUF1415 family protein, partial [Bacteroidota bacterium]
EYLDFLDLANEALTKAGLEGTIQIASFHPEYQFDGTETTDITNKTNQSPYPMLHFLREDSVEAALQNYPDPESIPERNMAKMRELFG